MRRALNPATEAVFASMPAKLAAEAERLGAGRPCPLDLPALLAEMGLGLTIAVGRGDATHGGALRQNGRGWEVVVMRTSTRFHEPGLLPRDRFTIAHELGHYFVEQAFGFKPASKGEYWRLEDVCNQFAAALLAPLPVVQGVLCEGPSNASAILAAIQKVRRHTEISFEAASRRVIEVLPAPAAVAGIAVDRDVAKRRVGWLHWVHENKKWMGGGRNRSVTTAHPVAALLNMAEGLLVGQVRQVEMAGASTACMLRGGDLGAYLVAALP